MKNLTAKQEEISREKFLLDDIKVDKETYNNEISEARLE